MSQEGRASDNIELVRRLFAAFADGDFDQFLELLDEDVDWRVSGYLTGDRNLRGREEVRRWLIRVASLYASGEQVRIQPREYRDLDESTVLALGDGSITRAEGVIEEQLGWIYRIENGRVAYMKDYLSHDEAQEAAREIERG